MELPFAEWLSTLLMNVNAADEHDATAILLRRRLEQLIAGRLPLRHQFMRQLPPLYVRCGKHQLYLSTDFGPRNAEEAEEAGYVLERFAEVLETVIYALSVDPLGKRVRRCDLCRRFFVAKRDHRRERSFCCTDHRRAFDHAHRDRKRQAIYMRNYRQLQTERVKRKKRARTQ